MHLRDHFAICLGHATKLFDSASVSYLSQSSPMPMSGFVYGSQMINSSLGKSCMSTSDLFGNSQIPTSGLNGSQMQTLGLYGTVLRIRLQSYMVLRCRRQAQMVLRCRRQSYMHCFHISISG